MSSEVKSEKALARAAEEQQQLESRHVSERQQLQQEQVEQLKAFKSQLLQDLLTQLSPQPPSAPLRPPPHIGSPNPSLSQSVAEGTPLTLSPHSHHLPEHSGSPSAPSTLVPPTRLSPALHTPPQLTHSRSPSPLAEESLKAFHPLSRLTVSPSPTHLSTHQAEQSFGHTHNPAPLPRLAWASYADNSPSQTREDLIEKHARHVKDLTSHYSSQLNQVHGEACLRSDPPTPEKQSNPSRALSPVTVHTASPRSQRLHSLSPSPFTSAVSHASQVRAQAKLVAENEQLKDKCTELESKLQQTSIVSRALEEQLENQKKYWLEWQGQAETYSHTIDVLQDKLDSCRTQLKQQDGMVEQLQADLQLSVGEIQFWKEQRAQEATKLDQVHMELQELQREKESLEKGRDELKPELVAARRELGRLEAATRASAVQENELKSTVQKLENRIRHLEHVNNRLHGQATHYSLGSSFPNSPDDDKLCRRPRSASHTPSSHHPPAHTSLPSPVHTLTYHSPPTSHTSRASDTTQWSPLNRRKWLQPSDPGLIFGTPPPSHTHLSPSSPPHRQSHTHQHSETHSPLLQSTGQAIAQRHSESGSSNDEEDPTSLARRGYINSSDKYGEGSGAERGSHVASTLSAIQSGKIKADTTTPAGKTSRKAEKESVQERVRRSVHVVAEAEERLTQLHKEKENLESMLQRSLRVGGRVTKHSKQAKLEMEQRLDKVLKEIGSVKMTLRSHHAFHK